MKTPLRALAFLPLFAAAALAAAGDEPAYKISTSDHWKVGQSITRSGKETDHQAVKVTTKDGAVVKDDATDTATEYVIVQKCAEIDGDGRWAKGLLYFQSWSQTKGAEKDESLKGVVIELSGAANAHAWKTVSDGAAPSDAAKHWIDKDMGPEANHDKAEALFSPKEEVAVGGSWTPDIAGFAEMMSKNLPIDVEKSEMKITLKAVKPPSGTLVIDFKLPTKGLPVPGSPTVMAWASGGTMTMKGEATRRIDGAIGAEVGSMEYSLVGDAGGEADPVKVHLEVAGKKDGSQSDGGDIPGAKPKTGG